MKLKPFALAALASLFWCGAAGAAAVVTVPATGNLWLAGMPAGSNAGSGDTATAQSPTLVTGLGFVAGNVLHFSSSGSTDHCTAGGCGLAGAEGDAGESVAAHAVGAQFGLSDIVSPIDALIAVFLDDSQPDSTAAPATLNFGTAAARNFTSLSPLLKQVFFIGNGLRDDGITLQDFVVPTGATRLFLGTMDGFGWFNNVGSLTVTVDVAGAPGVPEPGSLALLGLAALVAGGSARRRRAG